jgi:hypothetical protein
LRDLNFRQMLGCPHLLSGSTPLEGAATFLRLMPNA